MAQTATLIATSVPPGMLSSGFRKTIRCSTGKAGPVPDKEQSAMKVSDVFEQRHFKEGEARLIENRFQVEINKLGDNSESPAHSGFPQ